MRCQEAVGILGTDGESPELLAKEGNEFGRGGAFVGVGGSPFGSDGLESLREPVGAMGGQEKEGVGGGEESGDGFDGVRGADLRLVNAKEGFFVAEVEFDLPPPQIGLKEALQGERGIGADQVGGLAIEDPGVLGEAIAQGANDDETEILMASGGSPADGSKGFDLKLVDLPGGESGDRLPGDGLVLADLLRGGEAVAIGSETSPSGGLKLGKRIDLGVLADASDEDGSFGETFQDVSIGEAAIDADEEGAFLSVGIVIQLVPELVEPLKPLLGEIEEGLLLTILLPSFRGGVPARALGGGSRGEIDGNCAGPARRGAFGQGGGELEDALSPNEIAVERRTHGVASPGRARDLPTRFSKDGIVHHGHERSPRFQLPGDRLPGHSKQSLRMEAFVFEESKIGGPIGELPTRGGDQSGDGMTPETDEGAEGQSFGSLEGSFLCESRAGLPPEFLEGVHQLGLRFFLSGEAGG